MTAAANTLPPDADPTLRVDRAMTQEEMWGRPAAHVIFDDDMQYPAVHTMDGIGFFLAGQPRQRHMHVVV